MPDLAAKISLQGNIRIATEEELKLSSVLCAQSVVTLRQALKEPQTEIPSCLHFLELLLNGLHPELVKQEVRKLGETPNCQVRGNQTASTLLFSHFPSLCSPFPC